VRFFVSQRDPVRLQLKGPAREKIINRIENIEKRTQS